MLLLPFLLTQWAGLEQLRRIFRELHDFPLTN